MVYCWKCGTELKEDASFCYKCGATVKTAATATVEGKTGFDLLRDDKTVQNHWAKRIVAFIIDTVIVAVVVSILVVIAAVPFLMGAAFQPGFPLAFPTWGLWFGGIIPFVILAYFVVAEALYGRTLGKEMMGLKVERVDGKRMDLWSSFVRNISKIHPVLLLLDLLVGLGMHGETSQKFSDRYIGTKVVAVTKLTIIS